MTKAEAEQIVHRTEDWIDEYLLEDIGYIGAASEMVQANRLTQEEHRQYLEARNVYLEESNKLPETAETEENVN